MLLQRTQDARGYRQWQQVGRYVQRGSTAIHILAPVIISYCPVCERKVRTNPEQPDQCPVHRTPINHATVGFRTIPVFRYEDTEGSPLPKYEPKQPPPLMDVAAKWGLTIQWQNTQGLGAWGYYQDNIKTIALGTEDPTVFFHELAHAADTKLGNKLRTHDPTNEAVAELAACTLGKIWGVNIEGHAWNYIAQYADEKTPEAVGRLCVRVLGRVQKALELILSETTVPEQIPIPISW